MRICNYEGHRRAARRESKEFLLAAIEREMAKKPSLGDYTVPVPLIRSKSPGKRALTNTEIENLLATSNEIVKAWFAAF